MEDFFKSLSTTHWSYLAIGVPCSIFTLIFYLRNKAILGGLLLTLFQWLRPSLETNNMASPEKLTAFAITAFTYIPCRLIFTWKVLMMETNDVWHIVIGLLIGSLIDAGYTLMLYKILSPQQLIELKNGLGVKELIKDKTEETSV